MTSVYKIGTTEIGMTALDALTVPVPDPQPQFARYRVKEKLADGLLKGRGPNVVVWVFPLCEVDQIAQLETFQSDNPIFIQSRKRDDTLGIFEVLMNWNDPREDGEHVSRMAGYRNGLEIEFVVIQEVGA